MANRFCKKCGKEVAEGKRFCGGCGQAMPTATVPAQPEPVAAPQLCAKCGATLAPGKRFCKQCGQAVDQPTPVVEPAPAAVAIPAPPVCVHCGATLAPGKRFCKQCGQAVDSIAPAAQVKADSSEQGDSPATQPAVLDLPLAEPVAIAAPPEMPVADQDQVSSVLPSEEPDTALDSQCESASAWPSTPSPEESESPLPSSQPTTIASPTPSEPEPEPHSQSKMKLGLAIGLAAVVLLAAGGALAWHLHAHRGISPGTTSGPQQAMVTPPAQNKNPQPMATPQQPPKPAPGIQNHPASNPPQSHSASAATTPPGTPATIPVSLSHQHAQAVTPQPTLVPPPPSPPVFSPATPHSGVLHYQGPPVAYNGVVVFDHLPKARLRFAFDHKAWSLILKANPDGTKKATLISLAPGYQTSCDLGWEIVQ